MTGGQTEGHDKHYRPWPNLWRGVIKMWSMESILTATSGEQRTRQVLLVTLLLSLTVISSVPEKITIIINYQTNITLHMYIRKKKIEQII